MRSRLDRVATRVQDAALARIARQRAGDGVSAVEVEGEMRRFFRLVRTRLGPHPDRRELAALVAEEYGADAARIYRELKAARGDREKRKRR